MIAWVPRSISCLRTKFQSGSERETLKFGEILFQRRDQGTVYRDFLLELDGLGTQSIAELAIKLRKRLPPRRFVDEEPLARPLESVESLDFGLENGFQIVPTLTIVTLQLGDDALSH